MRAPDAQWGEVPVAFVARRDATLDEADAARALPRASSPATSSRRTSASSRSTTFPRSASGKVQRHELEAPAEGATTMSPTTTTLGTRRPTTSSCAARACRDELIGQAHVHRDDATSRSLGRDADRRADRASLDACLRRADGARPHAEAMRRAPRLRERARGDAGRGRRRAARRRQRVRRHGRGLRRAARPHRAAGDPPAEARAIVPTRTAASGCPGSVTRCTSPTIRARRACSRSRASRRRRPARRRARALLAAAVDRAPRPHLTDQRDRRVAAVLADAGVPAEILRGFALIARCAGLVGHIHEEQQTPAMPPCGRAPRRRCPTRGPRPRPNHDHQETS